MIKKLQKINEIVSIAAIFVMIVVVFAQVIGRYIFGRSITWGEELVRFLLVWISFLGAAAAAKKKAHIGIDAFTSMLKGKAKIAIDVFGDILIAGFWIYVGISGISMVAQNGDQISPALHVPMNVIYIAIPVGSLFLVLFMLEEYWIKIFKNNMILEKSDMEKGG